MRGTMIARIWRGVIRAEHFEEYIACIETTGGEYKRTPRQLGSPGDVPNRRFRVGRDQAAAADQPSWPLARKPEQEQRHHER
jgi:hypothetical protein